MTKKDDQYPTKADFEPNVDRYLRDGEKSGELPLSDPSESNATKEFRKNESQKTGENDPSAFNVNKEKNEEK